LKLLNPDTSPNRTVYNVPTAPLIMQPHYHVITLTMKIAIFIIMLALKSEENIACYQFKTL